MDTVIIKIYGPHKFKILDKSQFVPEIVRREYNDLSATEKVSPVNRTYLRRFVLHPNWHEQYLPRVEIFEALTEDRKNIRYILKATFSVAKLLYWNSLQEVGENDKQKVVSALKSALEMVGIIVDVEIIENATVEAVHACKNIPLPKTMQMREIINELAKIDINKAFDISEKQCKKGARVLNIYSGTIDWSFYDKISDSLRPKNKRNDKSHIGHERSVIERYNLQEREVFRYEYRIKKTQTTKREINTLLGREYSTQVVFKDLFTPNLLKTLVLNSWHALIERPENQISLFSTIDKLGLFLHILSEAKKRGEKAHSMNNALISYGLATAIRDHGAKEVRGAIFDVWSNSHSERLTKKIELSSELTKRLPYSNNITFIDTALERYELITLTSLENGV
jgi:hypothetical protein